MIFARLLKVLLEGCLNKTIYHLFVFKKNAVFSCFKYLIVLYDTSAEISFFVTGTTFTFCVFFSSNTSVTHQLPHPVCSTFWLHNHFNMYLNMLVSCLFRPNEEYHHSNNCHTTVESRF